jgi:CO/xanthine dehydrogenase Mo-binding subunit
MATHAVTLRSPHAHARIASITVSAALARSGVLAMQNAVRPDEISDQPGSDKTWVAFFSRTFLSPDTKRPPLSATHVNLSSNHDERD